MDVHHAEIQPMQLQTSERREGRLAVREQLCNLKYKCMVSLSILLVLLLETIVRRIEESVKNPSTLAPYYELWKNITLSSSSLPTAAP